MIGRAIYALLTGDSAVNALVEERVRPVKFSQAEAFPCIEYSTDGIQKVPVRSSKTYEGTLVIGVLAQDLQQIDELITLIRAVLDEYNDTIEGFNLSIDSGEESIEEEAPDLGAYYKSLDFEVTVTKHV